MVNVKDIIGLRLITDLHARATATAASDRGQESSAVVPLALSPSPLRLGLCRPPTTGSSLLLALACSRLQLGQLSLGLFELMIQQVLLRQTTTPPMSVASNYNCQHLPVFASEIRTRRMHSVG